MRAIKYNLYMNKLILLAVSMVLVGCDAKNSNVTTEETQKDSIQNTEIALQETETIEIDTMTAEEAAVAAKIGAAEVYKMAEDTFKVAKMVSYQSYEALTGYEYPFNSDSVRVFGVVSAGGKYYVPIKYTDVYQIGRDAFVGYLSIQLYDVVAPVCTEICQVVYKGRPIGEFTKVCDIKSVMYKGKVVGFLKILDDEECGDNFLYYIDTRGKGWDGWLGTRSGTYPHFEQYQIEGNILTLWGGGKTPEDVQSFFPEDRALYRVDLASGKVLDNPFVSTD